MALDRLRRAAAVERLIVRLEHAEPGCYVLKGGMALELRLGARARATRDVDLAMRRPSADGEELRERLIEALALDVDGDSFTFEVGPSSRLGPEEAGREAWRFTVRASLDGRSFDTLRLDIVPSDEVADTDRLQLPGALAFAGAPIRSVEAVAPTQHFAEKLHALTRDYGADRENTRVRDLVDLVLFIEASLADPAELPQVTRTVFDRRSTHPLPDTIPDPPPSWTPTYALFADDLHMGASTVAEAMVVLREYLDRPQRREEPGT